MLKQEGNYFGGICPNIYRNAEGGKEKREHPPWWFELRSEPSRIRSHWADCHTIFLRQSPVEPINLTGRNY